MCFVPHKNWIMKVQSSCVEFMGAKRSHMFCSLKNRESRRQIRRVGYLISKVQNSTEGENIGRKSKGKSHLFGLLGVNNAIYTALVLLNSFDNVLSEMYSLCVSPFIFLSLIAHVL